MLYPKRMIAGSAACGFAMLFVSVFFVIPSLAKSLTACPRPGHADLKASEKIAVKGKWTAVPLNGNYRIKFTYKTDGINYSSVFTIPKNDIEAVGQNAGVNVIAREAGKIYLSGDLKKERNTGNFNFKVNTAFEKQLAAYHIAGNDGTTMLGMALCDVRFAYLKMLNRWGFPASGLTQQSLLFMHNLNINDVFIKMLDSAGYHNLTGAQLIALKSLNTNLETLADKNWGIRDEFKGSFNWLVNKRAEWISNGHLGVSKDGICDLEKELVLDKQYLNSFSGTPAQLFNINDVIRDQVRRMAIPNLSGNELNLLIYNGMLPAFSSDLKGLLYSERSVYNLIALKSEMISGNYLRELKSAGYSGLSTTTLLSFKALGVTGTYIKGIKNTGLGYVSSDIIGAFKLMQVDSSFIKGLRTAGLPGLNAGQVALLKRKDITPQYISELKEKGVDISNVNKLIRDKARAAKNDER